MCQGDLPPALVWASIACGPLTTPPQSLSPEEPNWHPPGHTKASLPCFCSQHSVPLPPALRSGPSLPPSTWTLPPPRPVLWSPLPISPTPPYPRAPAG